MSDDMAVAEDRTTFDEAHPPLMTELTTEEGERVEVPTDRLPRLLFWHVLLRPFVPPKKTKGGIILADQVAEANEYHVPCYQVLQVGPLAFAHPRLLSTKRCGWRQEKEGELGIVDWEAYEYADPADGQILPEPGDWVIIKKHSGIRLQIMGADLRVVADDDILAVIDSPAGWKSYI